jgi:hypothetical protein
VPLLGRHHVNRGVDDVLEVGAGGRSAASKLVSTCSVWAMKSPAPTISPLAFSGIVAGRKHQSLARLDHGGVRVVRRREQAGNGEMIIHPGSLARSAPARLRPDHPHKKGKPCLLLPDYPVVDYLRPKGWAILDSAESEPEVHTNRSTCSGRRIARYQGPEECPPN